MIRRYSVITTAAALLALLLCGVALAQRGPGDGEGRRGPGPGAQGRIVYGVITQISDTQLTIEPRIPPEMAERFAERGRELPELPAEVTFAIDSATKFHYGGEPAELSAFAVGDEVVVRGAPGDGGPLAVRVADAETARQFIREQLKGRGEGQGWGGGPGQGPRGDRPGWGQEGGQRGGGPGKGGPGMDRGMRDGKGQQARPVFGEITALSDDSITISIEIPDFVQAKLTERGIELPANIPESVTLVIGERTRYAQSSEEIDAMPYAVGDRVAVLGGPGEYFGEPMAIIISDYASAEARMAEMEGKGRGGPDDERPRRGKNRRGGKGGRRGGGAEPNRRHEDS